MNLILLVTQESSFAHFLRVAMTNPAVWITLLTAAVIPLLNALATRAETHPGVKSAVAAVIAAIYALVAYLTDLGHAIVNWQAALGVFAIALIGAGGFGKALWAGPVVDWIHKVTDPDPATGKKGIGLKVGFITPERAAALHAGGQPPTMAPPQPFVVDEDV
jgi:hypothetical protein